MVLEVDLDDFVGESEHNSILRPHPLLDINDFAVLPSLTRGDGLLGCIVRE